MGLEKVSNYGEVSAPDVASKDASEGSEEEDDVGVAK